MISCNQINYKNTNVNELNSVKGEFSGLQTTDTEVIFYFVDLYSNLFSKIKFKITPLHNKRLNTQGEVYTIIKFNKKEKKWLKTTFKISDRELLQNKNSFHLLGCYDISKKSDVYEFAKVLKENKVSGAMQLPFSKIIMQNNFSKDSFDILSQNLGIETQELVIETLKLPFDIIRVLPDQFKAINFAYEKENYSDEFYIIKDGKTLKLRSKEYFVGMYKIDERYYALTQCSNYNVKLYCDGKLVKTIKTSIDLREFCILVLDDSICFYNMKRKIYANGLDVRTFFISFPSFKKGEDIVSDIDFFEKFIRLKFKNSYDVDVFPYFAFSLVDTKCLINDEINIEEIKDVKIISNDSH